MKMDDAFTVCELVELLDVDIATGDITYKSRDMKWFKDEREWKIFHSRFAGRPALKTVSGYGYKCGSLCGHRLAAHRVVWAVANGRWPSGVIDHINGDRLDNRIENLRSVSRAENQRNMKMNKANKSGVTGVWWNQSRRRWVAEIGSGENRKVLGYFREKRKAAEVRRNEERRRGYHENHGKPGKVVKRKWRGK